MQFKNAGVKSRETSTYNDYIPQLSSDPFLFLPSNALKLPNENNFKHRKSQVSTEDSGLPGPPIYTFLSVSFHVLHMYASVFNILGHMPQTHRNCLVRHYPPLLTQKICLTLSLVMFILITEQSTVKFMGRYVEICKYMLIKCGPQDLVAPRDVCPYQSLLRWRVEVGEGTTPGIQNE